MSTLFFYMQTSSAEGWCENVDGESKSYSTRFRNNMVIISRKKLISEENENVKLMKFILTFLIFLQPNVEVSCIVTHPVLIYYILIGVSTFKLT